MSSDYSETPLAKKLGIKEGYKICLYNPPHHYFMLFNDLPPNIEESEDPQKETIDFIHLFCTEISDLKNVFPHYKSLLKKNGLLWISWPKGASKIPTDLKREPIREIGLGAGLVDVKVAAIDKDWSGLKFVYRLKDR